MAHLLQPEARRRAVQEAEQREVVVLGRVGGSLMTGAVCLKTFPPRSRTKWLCVATKAKVMERGVRSLIGGQPADTRTSGSPASI